MTWMVILALLGWCLFLTIRSGELEARLKTAERRLQDLAALRAPRPSEDQEPALTPGAGDF